MKKTILILAVFISLIGIFISALPVLLRITALDKPLKEYLIPKIIDTSTGTLEIDKFDIGYGTLDFTDVSLNSSNGQFSINIDAISLRFSLWNIIFNPSDRQHAINSIYLVNPKVIIHKYKESNQASNEQADYRFFREKLRPLQQIHRVIVKNALIEWRTKDTNTIIAQNLNGWLTSEDSSNIKIDVTGDIFSYTANKLQLLVDIDLFNENIYADIIINNYDLSKSIFPFSKSYVEGLKSGIIDGQLKIENKGMSIDNMIINGSISVEKFTLLSDNVEIADLNFNGKIINNKLNVNDVNGLLFNAPISFSGYISDIFNPEINGKLKLEKIKIAKINTFYQLEIPVWDRISLTSNFSISFKKAFSYDLTSQIIFIYNNSNKTDHLSCRIRGDKDFIQMENMRSTFKEMALSGMFKYVIGDENVDGYIRLSYKTGSHVIFDNLSNKEQALNLGLRLNLKKWAIDGNWQYLIEDKKTLFTMSGNMQNLDNDLLINMTNSSEKNLKGSLIIKNYSTNPEILNANIENFPFALFTSNKILKTSLNSIYTEMNLSGNLDKLNGRVFVQEKRNTQNDFIFTTTVKNLFSTQKEIYGTVEIKNLKGDFSTFLNSEVFNAKIDFPEGISGKLDIDLTADEQLNGFLSFKDFKVVKVFSDSNKTEDFRMQGEINGNISISGSLDKPKYNAKISAEKFVVNNMGYYQAYLDLYGNNKAIYIDTVAISLNNQPYIEGGIQYFFESDSLNGQFSGENITIDNIFNTLGLQKPIITGNASYTVNISGTGKSPEISLKSSIKDGILAKVGFDQLHFSVSDFLSDSLDFYNISNHNLEIKELSLNKKGSFDFSANGLFPLDKKKEIDLSLSFDGDILRYLPNWEGFFLDGKSMIHLKADIGGNNNRIRIKKAKIHISDGELWLRDVAPHIQNINGRIEVKEGSNNIDFIDFTAFVDDQKIAINTVRNVTLADGSKLKPWYFRDLDLDFGILKLKTDEEGISLHIPGIMKKNEMGNIFLTGQNKDESFYFACPIKHPTVRGSIFLYNTQITYPFIISKKSQSKPSVAVRFLQKLNWDIIVKSGEDVLYVRDVPAYIDNVHAEVSIDESSPGLHLLGIINKDNFNVVGKFTSNRGDLEYLDLTFRVERFSVEFNKFNNTPDFSGRAYTTIRDSLGAIPKTIYLDLYTIDPETGREEKVMTLDNLRFKLVSAEPKLGETQEQVLSDLGYSVDNLTEKASTIGGAFADRYLIRPLLRPVERLLEKELGFDMVRVHSSVASNLFHNSLNTFNNSPLDNRRYVNPFTSNSSYMHLLQNSEIIVGKYLAQDVYLTYTGRLVSIYNQNSSGFDFNHSIGVEYRFYQNMLLEFQYDRESMGIYNLSRPNYYLQDFKIRLRFQHPISFF